MTNKQIICKCNDKECGQCSFEEQLQAKEQECERWKSNFNGKVSAIEELLKQLDQLKAELEQEKNWHKTSDEISKANSEYTAKLKQTLTEIKSILELYANSKVGEEQSDGTYKLSSGIWDSFGFCTTTYDPRPARQALQKISEVQDVSSDS